jgi:putative intracellular protease/amidase
MKRVAIVVSTVGYHWEELLAAYEAFERAGASTDFFTVNGAPPRPDPTSLKKSSLGARVGLGIDAWKAPDSPHGAALRERLIDVLPLASLEASRYDALYLPGGHGCLFDVNGSVLLHEKIAELYTRGALLSAVCHATSTFAFVRVRGEPIVRGHALTGFPAPLDAVLIKAGLVNESFLPLPLINDQALREAGAKLSSLDVAEATLNPYTVRVSPPFVTGVGPKAAARVAKKVIALLDERGAEPGQDRLLDASASRPTRVGT